MPIASVGKRIESCLIVRERRRVETDMKTSAMRMFRRFIRDTSGASLIEYSVALVVVTIIDAVIFNLGTAISGVINNSAGAF